MPNRAVFQKSFTDAGALIAHFRARDAAWGDARERWAFRGHGNDAAFTLVPRALRRGQELGYTHAPKTTPCKTNGAQVLAEFERLHEFYWAVDAQGLPIPDDEHLLRRPSGWQELAHRVATEPWPIDPLLSFMCLAQHYGIPTRLLDWSDRPLVAAYFAATYVPRGRERAERLSVWAVDVDWLLYDAWPVGRTPSEVYVVTAPRASNPNLHAQGGIFTTQTVPPDAYDARRLATPLETLVERRWRALGGGRPVMARLTLPRREAPRLLRLLHREGVSAATIFPGFAGIADALAERAHWDRRERVSCWLPRE